MDQLGPILKYEERHAGSDREVLEGSFRKKPDKDPQDLRVKMGLQEFWESSGLAFSVLRPWKSSRHWRRVPIKCLKASHVCEETHQPRKRVIDRISTVFQTFKAMVTNAWQQQLLIGPKVSESGMVEGLEEVPVGAHSQVSPPGTTIGLSYNPQRSASRPLGIHFCPSWPVH